MQDCSVCSRARQTLALVQRVLILIKTSVSPPCELGAVLGPTLGTINTKTLRELQSIERITDTGSFSSSLLRNSATSYGQETPPLYTLNLCFWTLHESGPMFHARHPAMCLMEFTETSRAGFNLLFQSPWVWKGMYQEEREGKERETRNQSTKWVHTKAQPALMWGLILLSGLTPLPQVLGLRGGRFPLWIA